MKIFLYLVLLAGLSMSSPTFAACRSVSSSANFGNLSSFTLAREPIVVETGSGLSCQDIGIAVFGQNTTTATFSNSANVSGNSPRLYNASSGSYIPYTICSDSSCSSTYSIGSSKTWSSTNFSVLFNSSDNTLPIYLKTNSGINVPAGTYTDTLTLNWNYNLCFFGIGNACLFFSNKATSTINVTMVVANDCAIDSAPDINFGSAALPSGFSKISAALAVRCTANAAYKVNLTGSNPTSGSWRQMAATTPSGKSYLQYQLQQSDGTVWTDTASLGKTGTGSAQTINYSAIINPAQSNQPAGSYSDTVTVTVSY